MPTSPLHSTRHCSGQRQHQGCTLLTTSRGLSQHRPSQGIATKMAATRTNHKGRTRSSSSSSSSSSNTRVSPATLMAPCRSQIPSRSRFTRTTSTHPSIQRGTATSHRIHRTLLIHTALHQQVPSTSRRSSTWAKGPSPSRFASPRCRPLLHPAGLHPGHHRHTRAHRPSLSRPSSQASLARVCKVRSSARPNPPLQTGA